MSHQNVGFDSSMRDLSRPDTHVKRSYDAVTGVEVSSYGDTTVMGGNVVVGDLYLNGMSKEQYDKHLQEEARLARELQLQRDIEAVRNSLRFPEIGARANQIRETHRGTFNWAIRSTNQEPISILADWISSSQSVFWVSGKPGSGKSTFMKFLSSHTDILQHLASHFRSNDILILRFYFWLYGEEVQRSLSGCLCTLLHDIFRADDEIAREYVLRNRGVVSHKSTEDWSNAQLVDAIVWSLNTTQKKGCIFLDGLDEFDKTAELRDILDLVDTLSQLPDFKLCISSRQELPFEKAFCSLPKVRLQDLTFQDIWMTAADKLQIELREAEYDARDRASIDQLAHTVASNADGVFLWAIMAVKSLCVGIRNEDDIETLTKRLQKMPREMSLLYEQMWSRLQEDEELYQDETVAYLSLSQYIPLSLLDFTLATDDELLNKCLHIADVPSLEAVDKIRVACKAMERKIRTRTAGLLEVPEVVPEEAWIQWHAQQVSDSKLPSPSSSIPAVCTCGFEDPRSRSRCCSRHQRFEKLYEAHDKKVQYVHRSAAEFVSNRLRCHRTAEEHIQMQMRHYRKLLLAQNIQVIAANSTLCQAMWFDTSQGRALSSFNVGCTSRPLAFQLRAVTTLLTAIQTKVLDGAPQLAAWRAFLASLPATTGGHGIGHQSAARALLENCPNAITHLQFDFNNIWMVPPETSAHVSGREWYQHGVLREWHARRQRGLLDVGQRVHNFEARNGLTPSYVAATTVGNHRINAPHDNESSDHS
ncbi:hypothetical protein PMZ80_007996 [Knufia obscura]|uniref:NACHT domain-containing protein n=1 Tax=Knufia obscura TaxID=1635080 RepID=A0ABR0RG71_9EURO|nr:hypothetical protein PMZ80_007996 [Knufia obscura]